MLTWLNTPSIHYVDHAPGREKLAKIEPGTAGIDYPAPVIAGCHKLDEWNCDCQRGPEHR